MWNRRDPEDSVEPSVAGAAEMSAPGVAAASPTPSGAPSLARPAESSLSRRASVTEGVSFLQMDERAKAELLISISGSLEDLVPVERTDQALRMILRRSFPVLTLFMLPVFVGSLVVEAFLRPTLSFGILLVVSLVSIALSIAAGVTNTILGVELRFKLRAIERRAVGETKPAAGESSPVAVAASASARHEGAGTTAARWE